jgi:hypothetical protein
MNSIKIPDIKYSQHIMPDHQTVRYKLYAEADIKKTLINSLFEMIENIIGVDDGLFIEKINGKDSICITREYSLSIEEYILKGFDEFLNITFKNRIIQFLEAFERYREVYLIEIEPN